MTPRSLSPERRRCSRSRSRDRRYSSSEVSPLRYRGSNNGNRRHRSRSPYSNRKRHIGDRENPDPSRVIGVFGLHNDIRERRLHTVFDRFGEIDRLRIIYDRKTGLSRGFGFVYFRHTKDAIAAKSALNGTELDGAIMRIDFSITEREHTPTPGVYLGRDSYRRSSYRNGDDDRRDRRRYRRRSSSSDDRSDHRRRRRY